MTTVYFVRHAEPNFNNHDDLTRELTLKGLEDRKLATNFLNDKGVTRVVSSPFKRAVDTVKEFADAHDIQVELIDDFRERRVDSCWIDDFNAFAKQQWLDFDYKLSDGETLREVQARNVAALDKLLTRYNGQCIAIGSHGTALSTVINYYQPSFGYDDFKRIQNLMPWIVRFCFDGNNCRSITAFDLFADFETRFL